MTGETRSLFYSANAVLLTLIVLGILVVANYMAFERDARYDVTEGKLYSLSGQTVKLLRNIDADIEILAFFKEVGVDRSEFQDLVGMYEAETDKVKVKFIDPDKEPGITEKYDVTEYGTAVLLRGNQSVKVSLTDLISGGIVDNAEEEITNAIIKLSRGTKRTVLFLTGHGERDIEDNSGAEGLGTLKRALEGESLGVKELFILREDGVPKGNSILIVAGPTKPFLKQEVQAIRRYLDEGGKAIFMIEPRSAKWVTPLLRNYGFDLQNNIVIDPSSKLVGGGDIAPIVTEYPPHEITEAFKFATIFPYSRSVNVVDKNGFATTLIAQTDRYSWAEDEFDLFDQGTAEKNPDDKPGPLGVAAVSEGGGGRIAVFGGVDFISNRFFDFSGNADFFLNTVNWVAGDEYLISIRPKLPKEGKLVLTVNQMRVIFSITVVILPAVILISGIAVWWRRRNM